MRGRVGGVVLTGAAGWSLEPLGLSPDLALTPFGGSHRFLDFALGALENAGITTIRVVPGSPTTPRAAYELALAGRGPSHATLLQPGTPLPGRPGRLTRLLAACRAACERGPRPTLLVAVCADHILRADLGALLRAHEASGADLTLVGTAQGADTPGALLLDVEPDGRVHAPRRPCSGPLGLCWTGGLVVRAEALAHLLERPGTDDAVLAAACATMHVRALDAFDGAADVGPRYWHAPQSLEAYYDAQMALCSAPSGLDLFDASWPIRTAAQALPAARVTLDEAGHPGHTLNVLMAEGATVRGATVMRSVLGHSVMVDACAEVEDSILFDGARIGRGATVRRAIVGPGAVVEDGQHVGYGDEPAAAIPLPSGLVLLPAAAPPARRAAAAR